jgi:thiol-disulfide isomerase/thioredoxin
VGAWSVRAGGDVQGETSERWHGVRHTDEGNQGRIDAMISIGASWAATNALALDAIVKVPFITHVVGGQLDMPAIVELGVAYRFGKAPAHHHHHGDDHDDDDDHDHARPPIDTTGADVIDLQPPGAAVALTPVAGKLTIFDFGAAWCEPCKTLEPALVALAKRHPDTVAVRRIDVVDWDSQVATKYLAPRGFALPHVKIFDASGTLVFERSSAPGKLGALIADITALVEPPPMTGPAQGHAVEAYRVEIDVTPQGFEPTEVKVPRDRPVTLVITRKTEQTCAKDVVLPGGTIRDLPLNTPVEVTITFTTPGPVGYACGMNMIKGTIVVQ